VLVSRGALYHAYACLPLSDDQSSLPVGHTHLRFEGNCDLRPAQSWAILTEAVVRAAREPGEVDFLGQIGEGLGLEPGAAQPFFDLYDEGLVEGLDGQAVRLFTFCLSYHLAVLLFDCRVIPSIL